MGWPGRAPAFIFAVFDKVDGSVRVRRALICLRMLVMKNICRVQFHMSKKTEISVKNFGGNQAPYLKQRKIQLQETQH